MAMPLIALQYLQKKLNCLSNGSLPLIQFAAFIEGCRVETFHLEVAAVDTFRKQPEVEIYIAIIT